MVDTRKTLLSGHSVEPMEGAEAEEYQKYWKGYTNGMVRLQPGGTLLTAPITKYHDRLWNLEVKPSDVFIMTYAKCGTTWMQEIVWTMRHNPTFDHPMANTPVNMRVPFVEFDSLMDTDAVPKPPPNHPLLAKFKQMVPDGDPADGIFVQMVENMAEPRTIKTHLPFSLISPKLLDTAKVVYVMRNPKDVVVSYMHHCRIMRVQDFRGDQDEFVKEFIAGDLLYGHYDAHLKEAFERRSHPNLHIVRFEDLKTNPLQEYTRLEQFLGTNRTQEEIQKICDYTSFAEMKKRDNVVIPNSPFYNSEVIAEDGGFFRKGEVGDGKEKLSSENNAKLDKWIQEKLGPVAEELKYLN